MANIALLLDEDVRPLLGEILRQRGHDVVHVIEVDRAGKTDVDQLAYAALDSLVRARRRVSKRRHLSAAAALFMCSLRSCFIRRRSCNELSAYTINFDIRVAS